MTNFRLSFRSISIQDIFSKTKEKYKKEFIRLNFTLNITLQKFGISSEALEGFTLLTKTIYETFLLKNDML